MPVSMESAHEEPVQKNCMNKWMDRMINTHTDGWTESKEPTNLV